MATLRRTLLSLIPKPCDHCGGDGVLVSYEWINGREVDVSAPCPACDEDCEAFNDRAEMQDAALQSHLDRMADDGREKTLMLFGAGWSES